jgi:hypothetical protein
MKKLLQILILSFVGGALFAQARVTTAEFQKTTQPAVEIDMPYSDNVVLKAIEERMQKLGYKGKESKGYTLYSGVRLQEFGNETYDLYIRAKSKGKKDRNSSTVTLLVSSGYEKFLGDSEYDRVVSDAKEYLANQLPAVGAYDLELQMEKLVNESNDLVKKKEKIERDIEENKKRQDEQRIEIENQRKIEETLKGKRSTRQN